MGEFHPSLSSSSLSDSLLITELLDLQQDEQFQLTLLDDSTSEKQQHLSSIDDSLASLDKFVKMISLIPCYTIFLFYQYKLNFTYECIELEKNSFLHFLLSTYEYHLKNDLIVPASSIDDESSRCSLLKVYPWLPSNIFHSNIECDKYSMKNQYEFLFTYHVIPLPAMKHRKLSLEEKPLYIRFQYRSNNESPFKENTRKSEKIGVDSKNKSPIKTIEKKSSLSKIDRCYQRMKSKNNGIVNSQRKLTEFYEKINN